MATAIAVSATTVGLGYIIHRLGQERSATGRDRSARWQVDYVAMLVEGFAFPRPFPLRRGARLIESVTNHSRWDRVAVDHWFDDRLPPAAAEAAEDRRVEAANDDMDAGALAIAAQMAARRTRAGEAVA